MKILWLIGCLVLASACSSFGVRCDARLRPINPPQASAQTVRDTPARKLPASASGSGSLEKP
jgi:hypothetical protein